MNITKLLNLKLNGLVSFFSEKNIQGELFLTIVVSQFPYCPSPSKKVSVNPNVDFFGRFFNHYRPNFSFIWIMSLRRISKLKQKPLNSTCSSITVQPIQFQPISLNLKFLCFMLSSFMFRDYFFMMKCLPSFCSSCIPQSEEDTYFAKFFLFGLEINTIFVFMFVLIHNSATFPEKYNI